MKLTRTLTGYKGKMKIEANIEDKAKGKVLSISAMFWNKGSPLSGDCDIGGQIIDYLDYFHYKGIKRFKQIWKDYHLNDLHAGTPEQEEALEKFHADTNSHYDYESDLKYLDSIDLDTVIYKGKEYTYGQGWLFEEVPQEELDYVVDFMNGKFDEEESPKSSYKESSRKMKFKDIVNIMSSGVLANWAGEEYRNIDKLRKALATSEYADDVVDTEEAYSLIDEVAEDLGFNVDIEDFTGIRSPRKREAKVSKGKRLQEGPGAGYSLEVQGVGFTDVNITEIEIYDNGHDYRGKPSFVAKGKFTSKIKPGDSDFIAEGYNWSAEDVAHITGGTTEGTFDLEIDSDMENDAKQEVLSYISEETNTIKDSFSCGSLWCSPSGTFDFEAGHYPGDTTITESDCVYCHLTKASVESEEMAEYIESAHDERYDDEDF